MIVSLKHIILVNNSENIGDDIQSLAASRFIPICDLSYLFRDDLSLQKIDVKSKLILNAWWGTKPSNILYPNNKVERLMISVHLTKHWRKLYSKKKWIRELKKYEPIGARDIETQTFLNSIGVNAYFSGCLTLTLVPNSKIKKNNRILAVDVSGEVVEYLKNKYESKIDILSQNVSPHLSSLDRFEYARNLLYLFSSYSVVITSRLHVALPCLALRTPVLLVRNDFGDIGRFDGLYQLTNYCTELELLSSHTNIFELSNPDTYLSYKKDLEDAVERFTGFKSHESLVPDDITLINVFGLLTMNKLRYGSLKIFFLSRLNMSFLLRKVKKIHSKTK